MIHPDVRSRRSFVNLTRNGESKMNTLSYKDMKMKISMIDRLTSAVLGVALALFAISSTATAQDDSISITPTYLHFADPENGQQSTPATITLTNNKYDDGVSVGTIALNGPHDFNFNLSSDNCSARSLALNSSCELQVTFVPASAGGSAGISAWVSIPYVNDGNDGNLSVYLSNQEDTEHEVQRRLSPVMVDLNIPEEMNAGTSYALDWTAMGYHSGYKTVAVMFDCTDIAEGECGGNYNDPENFHESELLTPVPITESEWTYSGERAQNFRYDYAFDVNATRPNGGDWNASGTPIVIRFYISSDEDISAGKDTFSLIIPGNLSADYYDTSGRKIQKIICPSGGCSNP